MPFNVNEEYQAVVFEIKGRFLGSIDGAAFKTSLADSLESGKGQFVIDLSKADFMDSSGIGVLIGGLTSTRRSGGDMRLAGMTKRIKNLFLITKLLGSVFDDYETVPDALRSYVDSPPGGDVGDA
ncbi:MAG: STAS domain-containing protein [Rhodothermia bacterium]